MEHHAPQKTYKMEAITILVIRTYHLSMAIIYKGFRSCGPQEKLHSQYKSLKNLHKQLYRNLIIRENLHMQIHRNLIIVFINGV